MSFPNKSVSLGVEHTDVALGTPLMQLEQPIGERRTSEAAEPSAVPAPSLTAMDLERFAFHLVCALNRLTAQVSGLRSDLERRSLGFHLRAAWQRVRAWFA